MRILVTGATGLIGTEVLKTLSTTGYRVTATDFKAGEIPKGFKFLLGDLRDDKFLKSFKFNFDAVIHLAAIHKRDDESGFIDFENNVNVTYKLFAEATKHNVKVVVYASSLSIYGTAHSGKWTSPEYAPFDEMLPQRIYDSYALSKKVNEQTAEMWSNQSKTAFVGLRFPFINTTESIEEHAIAQRDGDAKQVQIAAKSLWGYLDVRDAAHGILAVLEGHSVGSQTFNLAASDTTAPYPTLDMMAKFHPATKILAEIPGFSSLTNCSRWLAAFRYHPTKLLNRKKLGICRSIEI